MNENKTNINWFPGHMAKTRREIKEKLTLIDLIYEVVDARIPISSRIIDIDELVINKPKIIIMTKYDKCDKSRTDKIIDYYKSQGNIVIPVDLINGTNINTILKETNIFSDKLNEERKNKGLKPRDIRVLVVGAPNVGKSTLINRLVGKKVVKTGDTPGVTKQLSWIRIGKNIELLDSPGILWPKLDNQEHAYNMASLSSIKEEIVDTEDLAIYILNKLSSEYPDLLMKRYSLDKIDSDVVTLLDEIGKKRGAYIKGGEIDYEKVYNIVIQDLKNGLIGNITFDNINN